LTCFNIRSGETEEPMTSYAKQEPCSVSLSSAMFSLSIVLLWLVLHELFKYVIVNIINTIITITIIVGRAIVESLSCRLLTAEARILSQGSPCRICGGQSNSGTGFL